MIAVLQAILGEPTAPFHEDAVAAKIRQLLAACPHVSVESDPFGNLVARYRRGEGAAARWAFAAHMDHPGWVLNPSPEGPESPIGPNNSNKPWEFLGGVPSQYFRHDPPRKPYGPGEAFAMWELPAFELREGRIYSRACDDLVGCAAIVAMFQELERREADCDCYGLFTRAEEVGFVGAIELAKSGALPKSVAVISLETSAERPPAKMGEGVIVRVGDRTSIFDPAITGELAAVAAAEKIRFQRCLMPGGTCEATAYALYGYRCGALCVALGNYHNCGPEERIEPEFVALSDVGDLMALCTSLALGAQPAPGADAAGALKTRLEENLVKHQRFFRVLR